MAEQAAWLRYPACLELTTGYVWKWWTFFLLQVFIMWPVQVTVSVANITYTLIGLHTLIPGIILP